MWQAERAKEGSPERPCSSMEHSLLSQALRADSAAHTADGSMKAETEADNKENLQTNTVVRLFAPAQTQQSDELISLRQCLLHHNLQDSGCKLRPLPGPRTYYITASAGGACRQGWCGTGSTTQSAFHLSVSLDWGLSGTSRAPAGALPAHMWTL